MSKHTTIEWTDASFNPWIGITWPYRLRKGHSADPSQGACAMDAVNWLVHGRHGRQADHLQGVDPVKPPEAPKVLDAIADVVLAYRPKPKSRAGKARKRRAAKIAREKPRDG